MNRKEVLTDSNGKTRNSKSMLKLLPDDIAKLSNYIDNIRGAYAQIEKHTGVGDGTIRAGRAEGWLFSLPTLFKLKSFIRTIDGKNTN